jgi:iron complex transport system substrate-binding protein
MEIPDDWRDLPAIRDRRIFAVEANSYFSRPGPRLAEGVSILAHIFHPQPFPTDATIQHYRRI